MGDIIQFKGKYHRSKSGDNTSPFRFTVNWRLISLVERMADGGCKLYFLGGHSIVVDRTYEEVDAIAKNEWKK